MAATTTVAMRVSRANRAGRFFCWRERPAGRAVRLPARSTTNLLGDEVCHEADQRLRSARRNRHGNKDNGTKRSAGASENRRSPWKAAWTKWPSCVNTLQRRPRFSTLVPTNLARLKSPPRAAGPGSISRPGVPLPEIEVPLSAFLIWQVNFTNVAVHPAHSIAVHLAIESCTTGAPDGG